MLLSNYLLSQTYPIQIDQGALIVPRAVSYPRGAGIWSRFIIPHGFFYNGNTYISAVNQHGDPVVMSFAQGNATNIYTVLHSALEVDEHDCAALLLRDSDKKILAFYCKHNNTNMYLRISSNAEDVSAFAAETDLASSIGATAYTYPQVTQLLNETNDPIYLFYRDRNAFDDALWGYSKSTDGGNTWSSGTTFFAQDTSAYIYIVSDGQGRIDFAASTHPYFDAATKIYHFYYSGGSFYKTDGTLITASLPLTGADVTSAYTASGSDEVWVWDIVKSGDNIAIVHTFYPSGSAANVEYYYTLWNGSAWASHSIVASGGTLPDAGAAGESTSTAGICIDKSDINIVYLGKKVGSRFEIFKYVTSDSGTTWTSTSITSGSIAHNANPFCIPNHGTDALLAWWGGGHYYSYTNYSGAVITWRGP